MMQREPDRSRAPQAHGIEAWLPPLLLAITNVALVVALVWFIVVARSLRGRIPVPDWLIPVAIAAAALLSIRLLYRAVRTFRAARRGWRSRRDPPPAP